jgi:phosphoserine aminotransferase
MASDSRSGHLVSDVVRDDRTFTIPAAIKPADGRFGCGPSKVRPEQLAALASAGPLGTSFRRGAVPALVGRIREGLRELFTLPDDYQVVLGNGGATAFWNIATHGLIRRRAQHLSFGEFSARFTAVDRGTPWLAEPSVIESRPGTHPLPEPEAGIDTYALTHNETSTGVAMPIRRVGGADALMLVDATSSAGGLPVEPSEFDVYYFAPQKVFGSEGGLWVALMSPKGLARAQELEESRYIPEFFSLPLAIEHSARNLTYNTPSVSTLFLFAEQIDWLLGEGGLEWSTARAAASAEVIYTWAEKVPCASPFVADPAQRSPLVATIDFTDDVDAARVVATLRANGILDLEPNRKFGRNQMRVGLFPAIEPADVEALTACVDYVVEHLPEDNNV